MLKFGVRNVLKIFPLTMAVIGLRKKGRGAFLISNLVSGKLEEGMKGGLEVLWRKLGESDHFIHHYNKERSKLT